ncbi:MAG: TetR/AcrR family transcriptional regulator [Candidatus Azotimanducaceae bacterium WSBS_2022_MAG_OTU7]
MDVLTSEKATQDKVTSDKRQATRKALLEAAAGLVFEKGHDRISIEEITKHAGVATGTYYNYFDTKQDVFRAVAQDLQDELAAGLETTRSSIKDPAMKVAITLKYYFYQSLDNQKWLEFTRFTGLEELSLEQDIEARIEDIQQGVEAGRFKVDDVHFTESLIRSMVRHVSSATYKGHMGRNAIDSAIRSILQMLGLPEVIAKAQTQIPLPPIAAQKRAERPTVPTRLVTSLSKYQNDRQRADSLG